MKHYWPHVVFFALLVAVIVVLGACESFTGPTCTNYLQMEESEQRNAAYNWLIFTEQIDDRSASTVEVQTEVARTWLVAQCQIQVQQDIPTTINQFRP